MNREIFDAIKYLDFAPASQRRVPSDTPQSDDQGRPGEGSPCPPSEFLDWQARKLNTLTQQLELRCHENAWLVKRLEETTRDRNWWICVALVAAGLGGLLLWVK